MNELIYALQNVTPFIAHRSVVVLTLLMAMFTVLAHWFACIWYCIGSRQLQSHPANWTVGQHASPRLTVQSIKTTSQYILHCN